MRLEVSRKADLATRTLLELARTGSRSKSADLAAAIGTTPGFLSQVIAPLAVRGWVHSEPGPTGGYAATVDLDDVSVLEVIEAVEGPSDNGMCVLEDRPCDGTSACALHVPWTRARTSLLAELAATPLSSLTSRPGGAP
ncbi:MAG: Rrf2 family transcriptional regulator [Acidimicrobiia bacterium]